MIITVKNLGVIKKAEFDTSKKLTVFCGPNSTGKTYLSYVINAIHSDYLFTTFKLKSFEEVKTALSRNEKIKIKREYIGELFSKISSACKKNIGEIFGISEEKEKVLFEKFTVNFSLSDIEYDDIINYSDEIDTFLHTSAQKFGEFDWVAILRLLLFGSSVYMFPVERNSIYTFKTELSTNRNQLIDKILLEKKSSKITDIVKKAARLYPLVIRNSITFANTLETIQKKYSDLRKLAEEIEDRLLHGRISINQNGEIDYKVKDVSLPFGISSSIVKTLSNLIVTLKYQVDDKSLLIIDEPEMNLHPNNQVILAEVLAKISNNVRMVVSTHSDYIIREFNNLIVAKSLEKKGNKLYQQFYDKDSLLDFNEVQVLYFDFSKNGNVNVKSLDVDEYGFAVESMDETVRSQNQRSNTLYIEMDNDEN